LRPTVAGALTFEARALGESGFSRPSAERAQRRPKDVMPSSVSRSGRDILMLLS